VLAEVVAYTSHTTQYNNRGSVWSSRADGSRMSRIQRGRFFVLRQRTEWDQRQKVPRQIRWVDSWSSHQDSEELSTSFFWWRSRDEIEMSK